MNSVCRSSAQFTRRRPLLLLFQSFYSSSSSSSELKTPPFPSSSNAPKPKQIPFQAKVANSVHLIGRISQPIHFQASPDHKHWAATAITHHPSSHSPLWIPIIFEGDLADVAACHLKENDHVYIAGQLTANPPPIDGLMTQAKVQIMVRTINFVEGSPHVTKSRWQREEEFLSKQAEEEPIKESAVMNTNADSLLNSWQDLLDNPKEWWDCRDSKLSGLVSPKYPDFKRKDGGVALWLNRAPVLVLSKLEKVDFDVQIPMSKQAKQLKGDESWKNLVENPTKWWDNRVNKRNVKAPDFKHKETGEGLWLGDSPTWVLSKLPPLKSENNVVASCGDKQFS